MAGFVFENTSGRRRDGPYQPHWGGVWFLHNAQNGVAVAAAAVVAVDVAAAAVAVASAAAAAADVAAAAAVAFAADAAAFAASNVAAAAFAAVFGQSFLFWTHC